MSLAEILRPQRLDDVLGQAHICAADAPIGRMADQGRLVSMVLWGPPGSGKTTIARILGQRAGYVFAPAAATSSGLAEFRALFADARQRAERTLLFIDEIHRLTRTQQDVFLPVLEAEEITLIGATTENPSFALSAALLSRMRVFVLERLDRDALGQLMSRAERRLGRDLPLDDAARAQLCGLADGDARFLLMLIEAICDAVEAGAAPLNPGQLADIVQQRAPIYDRAYEAHYNLISALHKSIRGSDVDAALYWLARQLAGGEDAFYILRRLARAASEDIGMADPQALAQVLAAKEAYAFLGAPEGELAIAQAVIYLATAPKSNAVYKAFGLAQKFSEQTGSPPPPKHILNAPTKLMKELGYGKDYVYEHHQRKRFSGQRFFPETVEPQQFYRPPATGFEKEIARRLEWWAGLRKKTEA